MGDSISPRGMAAWHVFEVMHFQSGYQSDGLVLTYSETLCRPKKNSLSLPIPLFGAGMARVGEEGFVVCGGVTTDNNKNQDVRTSFAYYLYL